MAVSSQKHWSPVMCSVGDDGVSRYQASCLYDFVFSSPMGGVEGKAPVAPRTLLFGKNKNCCPSRVEGCTVVAVTVFFAFLPCA